jgi:hypothetical protein
MAVLNPPDIVPEAMRYLIRALLMVPGKPLAEDELIDLVAPAGMAEAMTAGGDEDLGPSDGDERETRSTGRTIAEASLGALRTLDLVAGGRDGLALAPEAASRWKRASDVSAMEFSKALLEGMATRYQPNLVPASGGAADLVGGLSMLYSANEPINPFTGFDSPIVSRRFIDWQKEKLGNDDKTWPLFNTVRWPPFRRWAVYLGVARVIGSALLPEASLAVERVVLIEPGEYPVSEFVHRCLRVLPFLDTSGTSFGHDAEVEADHAVLSPGFSLTLATLKSKGIIEFARKSDTGGRTLRFRQDPQLDHRVTHVSWIGMAPRARSDS